MNIHVELGCGNNLRPEGEGWEDIGVDIIEGDNIKICNLGFENLPFDDDSIDMFQAIDVLEHIPKCIWAPIGDTLDGHKQNFIRHNPMIDLMNEIYRCIKNNGVFKVEVPFSDWAIDRDPTHVNKFARDWWHYYKKDDNLYYDQGLIKCNFKVTTDELVYENNTLRTHLIANKSGGFPITKTNRKPLI
jgi:predicted SAM-dependent methyltransferase